MQVSSMHIEPRRVRIETRVSWLDRDPIRIGLWYAVGVDWIERENARARHQRLVFWLAYRQHFVEAYERGPYG